MEVIILYLMFASLGGLGKLVEFEVSWESIGLIFFMFIFVLLVGF